MLTRSASKRQVDAAITPPTRKENSGGVFRNYGKVKINQEDNNTSYPTAVFDIHIDVHSPANNTTSKEIQPVINLHVNDMGKQLLQASEIKQLETVLKKSLLKMKTCKRKLCFPNEKVSNNSKSDFKNNLYSPNRNKTIPCNFDINQNQKTFYGKENSFKSTGSQKKNSTKNNLEFSKKETDLNIYSSKLDSWKLKNAVVVLNDIAKSGSTLLKNTNSSIGSDKLLCEAKKFNISVNKEGEKNLVSVNNYNKNVHTSIEDDSKLKARENSKLKLWNKQNSPENSCEVVVLDTESLDSLNLIEKIEVGNSDKARNSKFSDFIIEKQSVSEVDDSDLEICRTLSEQSLTNVGNNLSNLSPDDEELLKISRKNGNFFSKVYGSEEQAENGREAEYYVDQSVAEQIDANAVKLIKDKYVNPNVNNEKSSNGKNEFNSRENSVENNINVLEKKDEMESDSDSDDSEPRLIIAEDRVENDMEMDNYLDNGEDAYCERKEDEFRPETLNGSKKEKSLNKFETKLAKLSEKVVNADPQELKSVKRKIFEEKMKRKLKKNQKRKFKESIQEEETESKKLVPSPSTKLKKPKKSRAKVQQSSEKKKNYFDGEDYIPIDVSGATKFAVAKVEKLKPYNKHNAATFKYNMLFGKRVKRFSSNKTLDMYKLKQKAGELNS